MSEDSPLAAAGAIGKAGALIKAGGVVIFPTRALYGLGADALNREAVTRIYRIKNRPQDKPLPVLVSTAEQMAALIEPPSDLALRVMRQFWPGRLTLVLNASPICPPHLTAGTGKIGIRQAANRYARALLEAAQSPLIATSANRSGMPGSRRVDQLDPKLMAAVDMVLDGGTLPGRRPSSVVDVSADMPVLLRKGAVPLSDIMASIAPARETRTS
jgi:L-threonylcarbamoyladenylate synthase